MVQRRHTAIACSFEHWEIHHPQRCPAFTDLSQVFGDFNTQCAQGLIDDLRLVGAEEDNISCLRIQFLHQCLNHIFRHELQDWRLQPFQAGVNVIDLDPGQPLRAVDTHVLRIVVYYFTADARTLGDAQRYHAAVRIVGRATKYFKLYILHQVANID